MGVNRDVRVHVGELVLDGFEHVDRDLLAAAFRSELVRLVRERGVPAEARQVGELTGLPELPRTNSPARLGEALARAVHAGLTGRGNSR
ncbi:hypothetical protein E1161_21065 [Saccharopolyspora aridisoli]|uniref:Uncharacterized protein n=1 Tax=Saccharopolyspora aridisoli TaxID=2530385 RepID=A0A4R4UD21_9PSEU|nr:hypothetical protein [Saccharopolyspora aridisoli]TDC89518.1 hypothetical protein E1161_21065 [Saccharopolyspora aridisoli]